MAHGDVSARKSRHVTVRHGTEALLADAARVQADLAALRAERARLASERQQIFLQLAAHGWTTRKIAAALGISHQRVAQIMQGR